jgi:hypothetical protein
MVRPEKTIMLRGRHANLPTCPICNEPVELKNSKTDGNGRAVHEECFAFKLRAREDSGDGEGHSWRSIAEEVMQEMDPAKLIELTEKLNAAMLEEEREKVRLRPDKRRKGDTGGK